MSHRALPRCTLCKQLGGALLHLHNSCVRYDVEFGEGACADVLVHENRRANCLSFFYTSKKATCATRVHNDTHALAMHQPCAHVNPD